jgi:hypothetical protein
MEPDDHIAGPVSPELVLVDPELAAAARAALSEHPWPAPVRIEPAPRPPRGRRPTSAIVWLFVPGLALVLIVFGLTLVSTDDRPTFAAGAEPSRAPTPAQTAPRASPTAESQAARQRSAPTAARRPSPTRKATPETKARPRVSRKSRPARRASRPRFTPARSFAWPPHSGAAYYRVTFLRNGRPFYRKRSRTALLRLPERVRFTTGEYRWTVRPAITTELGIRLGPPIVDSTFRVGGD